MASVTREKNGRKTIQFIGADGKRRSIRLGKTDQRAADGFRVRVEELIAAKTVGGGINSDTAQWIAKLSIKLKKRLWRVGLLDETAAQVGAVSVPTLGQFLETYIQSRTDVKPATKINWGHTQRNLLSFFGHDKRIADINAGDAKDFERFLKSGARENGYADTSEHESLSPATIRKRISNCKQFFNDAVDRKLLDENPFAKLRSAVHGNRNRQAFVSQEVTQKIIDACPDEEWRLLVALARYGGLRTPSESLSLRWEDIDWNNHRMTVRSPKTEHHEGKESRLVPLFSELLPYLRKAREMADDEATYIFNRLRRTVGQNVAGWKNVNLRTQFERIIKRAGVKPWPKLWQNLRSSRQTELEHRHPTYLVCSWLGNSERVARNHYLQVTDEDYRSAAGVPKVVQNPVQYVAATDGMELHGVQTASEFPENSLVSLVRREYEVGGTGFEPVTSAV